jgi:hypothetical protein
MKIQNKLNNQPSGSNHEFRNDPPRLIGLAKLRTYFEAVSAAVFLISLAVSFVVQVLKINFSLSSFLYWQLLVIYVYIIIQNKIGSEFTLKLALMTFIIGAVFSLLGSTLFGETIFRISLICWTIGVGQALIENLSNATDS